MKIAIIGTGNVGGALATQWSKAGHTIYLGVKNTASFKGMHLLEHKNTQALSIAAAVEKAEVILLATPATVAIEVAQSLGDTTGKIIIDAMNIIMGKGPEGYTTTSEAILAHTHTEEVVKCFNTTGYNNMENPQYGDIILDLFTCGDSTRGKDVAIQLAKDAGFAQCYDIGGNDKFEMMEQFAWFWINMALFQGWGREIGFKLMKR